MVAFFLFLPPSHYTKNTYLTFPNHTTPPFFLRDRVNPLIDTTILMLRRPSSDTQSRDRTGILYAFAPGGGRYILDLAQSLPSTGSIQSCDALTHTCQTIDNPTRFQLQLKPAQFRVLVLTPKH